MSKVHVPGTTEGREAEAQPSDSAEGPEVVGCSHGSLLAEDLLRGRRYAMISTGTPDLA